MDFYKKAKNKVTTGRPRGPTTFESAPPPCPLRVDIEEYNQQTKLVADWKQYVTEIRHDIMEGLGPMIRSRLQALRPKGDWGTKELVHIMNEEIKALRAQKDEESHEQSVSGSLEGGEGEIQEEHDPILLAMADREAALRRDFTEEWKVRENKLKEDHKSRVNKMEQDHKARVSKMEQDHKLDLRAKDKDLIRMEDGLKKISDKELETTKKQHAEDMAQHRLSQEARLDALEGRWKNYVADLQETHHAFIRSKDGEIQLKNDQLQTIEDRVNREWQQRVEGLRSQIGQLRNENTAAVHRHEQELQAKEEHHTTQYDLLAAAKISMEAAHDKAFQDLQRSHGDRILQLQRGHDQKLQSMKSDHNEERRKAETRFEEEKKNMKSRFDEEQAQSESRFNEEQRQFESRFAVQRERLNAMIAELRKKLEDDIQDLKLTHMREMTAIDDEHELEVNKLKAEKEQIERQIREQWQEDVKVLKQNITSLNAILFARDRFTAVPDRVLGEKFSSLVHDVQNLARQPWRPDQRVWTDAALKSITSNTSRLREQLLQDRIWWTLHDFIFCSPFRMFGEEGRTLESGWNTACGRDFELRTGEYTWPKPALDTERWRWEAVKACQSALKEPASHLSDRAKIKRGFKESRDNLTAALRKHIEEVARFDQSVMVDVEKLVKKAVNLWLEFEIQRCRLMMVMPVERVQLEEDKMDLARQQKLTLTSLPGLIRFGDDSGQELNVRQTVGSCNPDVVRVS